MKKRIAIIIISLIFAVSSFSEDRDLQRGMHIREVRQSPFALHATYGALKEAYEAGAKTIRVIIRWEDGEARKGVYRYQRFDAAVREIQEFGLEPIVTLRPVSDWGVGTTHRSKTGVEIISPLSAHPKDMDAWIKFVTVVVERYDADGKNDMPGLKSAINFWQVDNEWIWQWQGTGEEYLQFLTKTSEAVKEANPNAKIILGALTGTEEAAVVEGIGREDYVEFGNSDENMRIMYRDEIIKSDRYQQGLKKVLPVLEKGHPYFDIIDFHSYTTSPYDIADSVELLQKWMEKYGYEKPLWSLENAGPYFDFAQDKFAEDVVKRYIIGIDSGVERIFWSSLKPTLGWSENYLRLALLDTHNVKTPAYYTYKLMTEKLSDINSIERLPIKEGIAAYKVKVGKGEVYVVWSDKGTQEALLPISASAVKITHIITESGTVNPKIEQMPISNGVLSLRVSAPVFVETVQ